jgi:hypothetical protein
MSRHKWIVLEDEDWKIVMPETDIQAHSTETKGDTRVLAYSDCPCLPRVSVQELMIIHNSFAEKAAVDEAMNAASKEDISR